MTSHYPNRPDAVPSPHAARRKPISSASWLPGWAQRVNADEEGAISLLTVFAVLVLTMLLGMVMNVGRHVDSKIRMQNAADASVYSGSVVLARGMNTLAFTNHLLSDVFALTAFLREARDGNSETYMPAIFDAWDEAGDALQRSRFSKFERLGVAVQQHSQLERELVRTYGVWSSAASELILPVLEEILRQEMIPEFQRSVVEVYPDIAQQAAAEAALKNSLPGRDRDRMSAILVRTSGLSVNGATANDPVLPVVDPLATETSHTSRYSGKAKRRRDELAFRYLRDWNRESLVFFDHEACQFATLWRAHTCGYLHQLLDEEYPSRNLPHMIRTELQDIDDPNTHLDEDFTFLAVVSRRHIPEISPGLFRNPLGEEQVTFAAARMFIPRRRLIWRRIGPGRNSRRYSVGGVPGDYGDVAFTDAPIDTDPGEYHWKVDRQGVPTEWDLFNQSWTAQLVPATQGIVAAIVQTTRAPATGPEESNPTRPEYDPDERRYSESEQRRRPETDTAEVMQGGEYESSHLRNDDVRRLSTH